MSAGLPQVNRHTPEVCSHTRSATVARIKSVIGVSRSKPIVGMVLVFLLTSISPSFVHPNDGIQVLTDRDEGSALLVDIEGQCSEVHLRVPEARVVWRVDSSRAPEGAIVSDLVASEDFRVDFSKYPEGLERSQFESLTTTRAEATRSYESAHEPVDDAKSADTLESLALVIGNLEPGVVYRTRVLALTPEGWISSPEVRFMSPVCAVDGLDEMEGGVR